ncbi:hypothetical protein M427DRAFT_162117 [Gonapodya prolifera JEL478]|uniref:Uncharacterized protein n=1 Tax=Gonapodya prolifera (strain JEL478) TaxID=1344416 RepID=A0A139AZ93_GONPJ|nr:hypothetical protein M427DRAFT_162117 [Gonapodya prolifera JEL478]|eukprot:KXS22020.1 hypothetical protein M427DRAFT_162117 [Gonapodya prolifera JEL478]
MSVPAILVAHGTLLLLTCAASFAAAFLLPRNGTRRTIFAVLAAVSLAITWRIWARWASQDAGWDGSVLSESFLDLLISSASASSSSMPGWWWACQPLLLLSTLSLRAWEEGVDQLEREVDNIESQELERRAKEKRDKVEAEVIANGGSVAVKKSIKKRKETEARSGKDANGQQGDKKGAQEGEFESMSEVEKLAEVHTALFGGVSVGSLLFFGGVQEKGIKDRYVPPSVYIPIFTSLICTYSLPFIPSGTENRGAFLFVLILLRVGCLLPIILQLADPLASLVRHEPTMLHPRAAHLYRFIGAFNLVYVAIVMALAWGDDADGWLINIVHVPVERWVGSRGGIPCDFNVLPP